MRYILIILSLLVFLPAKGITDMKESVMEKKLQTRTPLTITANEMVTDNINNFIEFTGNVVAIKEQLTVIADKMVVWGTKDQLNLKKIVAIGSVKITRGKKIATGRQAHYFPNKKKIELTGDSILYDGKNYTKGEKVVYYFDQEDMIVTGNKKKTSNFEVFP